MPQADAPRLAAVLIVWGVRRPNLCVCSTIIGIWSKCVKPPPKTNRIDRIVVPLGVFFNNIKRLKTKEINRTALKTTTTIINTHIVAVVARHSRRPSRGLCYRNKVAKWLIKAHAEVCLCASQRNWKKKLQILMSINGFGLRRRYRYPRGVCVSQGVWRECECVGAGERVQTRHQKGCSTLQIRIS